MVPVYKKIFLFCFIIFAAQICKAQLKITNASDAASLVQRLVGQGVSVSNITFTGKLESTGFFNNISGTKINIDSGIVLTNGLAKSTGNQVGMDNITTSPIQPAYFDFDPIQIDSASTGIWASNNLQGAGDADLTALLTGAITHDATVLEFDFVPLGDSIKFRYVFGSEEYPDYPCAGVNDAFAFFINKVGSSIKTNIALVPGTTDPVTIDKINYKAGCGLYPQYFISNRTNTVFTYNGHTTVFTALAKVQPCNTYHLKLVIADVGDNIYDSGVLLEAKSLTSNAVKISSVSQIDNNNNAYVVEGCTSGSIILTRASAETTDLPVTLTYDGNAINGIDVQLLPAAVTIPANQTSVTVPLVTKVDNLPEGIELLKIYAFVGCSTGSIPSDSLTIQIRDYDTLGIAPRSAFICNLNSVQLAATAGYDTYTWDADPSLSNTAIRDPIAKPTTNQATYYCSATLGNCNARDSVYIGMKRLSFVSKKEINCKNGNDGEIIVAGGAAWTRPASFNINSSTYQADSTFKNLTAGTYTVRMKDALGCIDSVIVNITQLYPDLVISKTLLMAASCTGGADGTVAITATGGKGPYRYSADGLNFQADNILFLNSGNYTVTVMDNNNCTIAKNITIPLNNSVIIDAGPDTTICESLSAQLHAISNASSFVWSPAATVDNNIITNPIATPAVTTKYFIVGKLGVCDRIDSLTVFVNPAPIADAGKDQEICFGNDAHLKGSGGVVFLWTPGSLLDNRHLQNPTVKQPFGSVTYTLNVVDANGCQSLQKDIVYITVTRKTLLDLGPDDSIAISQPLQLFARDVNGSGFVNFIWSPPYGLNNAAIQDPIAILEHDVTYLVTATTTNGCVATDVKTIKAYKGPDIYVPKAFTPNNDGINDILKAIPIGIKEFHFFTIYDRWGVQVFSTKNADIGWDGKLKGKGQDPAGYVWMAEGVSYLGKSIQRKGTVVLLR